MARELALMDPWMLPWRILYEVFSRMELSGEVRRGYFVEGLSGEAVCLAGNRSTTSGAACSFDGGGSGDSASQSRSSQPVRCGSAAGHSAAGRRYAAAIRRAGNWLVLRAGRPILLVEGQGARLTALPEGRLVKKWQHAVACLPSLLEADRGLAVDTS